MGHISLPITTRFEKIEQINSEFTRCRCRIMALGKNRNGSHFSRSAVEDAIPTFKNIPVIAYLYEGDDGNMHVAGHEMKVVKRDGKSQFVTKCVPYGTVPDGEFTFEEVTEANGTKATYLTADVILWSGKYPEIMDAVYSDDVYYGQSMEIKCLKTEEFKADKRYTDITKFSASALCLLGKSDDPEYHVEPCFPSSNITPYSFDKHFAQMMDEFKFALAECMQNVNKAKEVEEMKVSEEKILEIFAEFGFEGNSIGIEITEDMTEETLRENIAAYVADQTAAEMQEPEAEETEGIDKPEEFKEAEVHEEEAPEEVKMSVGAQFGVTYKKKREIMENALREIWVSDDANDHYVYYWLCDFDDNYIYVNRYYWNGYEYSEGVGRIAYAWNEEAKTVTLTGETYEEMYVKWLTAEELEVLGREKDEFAAYKESHSYENSEVEALKQFKEDCVAEEHRSNVEAILADFEDLVGNEEFEALRESAINFEKLEELETACYAIRGKTMKAKFSIKDKKKPATTIPVVHDIKPTEELYGGLFSMYGNK